MKCNQQEIFSNPIEARQIKEMLQIELDKSNTVREKNI
jgi:hypothetical protein